MKIIKNIALIAIISHSLPALAEAQITKNFFIQSTGVLEMCSNKKYLNCLGLEIKKCTSDINDCLKIIPSKFTNSESKPLMDKFNNCLLSKNNFSDEIYDKCDKILDTY